MFEGMIQKEINKVIGITFTPEKIAMTKARIIARIAEERLIENLVDGMVDSAVEAIRSIASKEPI